LGGDGSRRKGKEQLTGSLEIAKRGRRGRTRSAQVGGEGKKKADVVKRMELGEGSKSCLFFKLTPSSEEKGGKGKKVGRQRLYRPLFSTSKRGKKKENFQYSSFSSMGEKGKGRKKEWRG